ncbi:hypothetical protein AB5I41_26620 [Sphingomonas sp. MMS24-JH45]
MAVACTAATRSVVVAPLVLLIVGIRIGLHARQDVARSAGIAAARRIADRFRPRASYRPVQLRQRRRRHPPRPQRQQIGDRGSGATRRIHVPAWIRPSSPSGAR